MCRIRVISLDRRGHSAKSKMPESLFKDMRPFVVVALIVVWSRIVWVSRLCLFTSEVMLMEYLRACLKFGYLRSGARLL